MANDPKNKKDEQAHPTGETQAWAHPGEGGMVTSHFPATSLEDEWTEAEADEFINKLVERNKEALRGLAKL